MKSTVAHRPRARPAMLPALLALALLGGCGREPASYTEDAPQVSAGQILFPAGSRQLDVLRSELVTAGASASLQLPGRVVWTRPAPARCAPRWRGRWRASRRNRGRR